MCVHAPVWFYAHISTHDLAAGGGICVYTSLKMSVRVYTSVFVWNYEGVSMRQSVSVHVIVW